MNSWSTRWLVGTGAAIAVLVVASVLAAVLAGGGDAETFPEDSPEGVVQRYLQAIEDDEFQTAYDYLGSALREGCTLQEFRERTRRTADRDHRVVLEGTEAFEGQTIVMVRISRVQTDAPFAPSESSYPREYTLERQEGAWRFTEPAWPLNYCPPAEKTPPTPEPSVAG